MKMGAVSSKIPEAKVKYYCWSGGVFLKKKYKKTLKITIKNFQSSVMYQGMYQLSAQDRATPTPESLSSLRQGQSATIS